jgi:hypothetical protein
VSGVVPEKERRKKYKCRRVQFLSHGGKTSEESSLVNRGKFPGPSGRLKVDESINVDFFEPPTESLRSGLKSALRQIVKNRVSSTAGNFPDLQAA